MPYTKLTSFQFERGKGFTEESVLTFRVLALNVIDELMRHESPGATMANFSLTPDEVQLILDHRRNAYGQPSDVAGEVRTHPATEELPPPAPSLPPPVPDFDGQSDIGAADDKRSVVDDEVVVVSGDVSGAGLEDEPVDDEFAAAARWLALATRGARPST